MTVRNAYANTNQTKLVGIDTDIFFSSLYPGRPRLKFTCVLRGNDASTVLELELFTNLTNGADSV